MTFDIGLHEACVRVGGRAGVRYIITKFSQMDSLPNFLTHGAPLCARFAREELRYYDTYIYKLVKSTTSLVMHIISVSKALKNISHIYISYTVPKKYKRRMKKRSFPPCTGEVIRLTY